MAVLEANNGVEFQASLVAVPRDEAAATAKGVNRRGDKASGASAPVPQLQSRTAHASCIGSSH